MTKQFRLFAFFVLAGSLIFSACNKDDDEPEDETPTDFVATDATFSGFDTWATVLT